MTEYHFGVGSDNELFVRLDRDLDELECNLFDPRVKTVLITSASKYVPGSVDFTPLHKSQIDSVVVQEPELVYEILEHPLCRLKSLMVGNFLWWTV